jgi:hypothetical protein
VEKSYVLNKGKALACIAEKLSPGLIPWWSFPMVIRVCSLHLISNNLSRYHSNVQRQSCIQINLSKEIVPTTLHKTSSMSKWITTMSHKINGSIKIPDRRPWIEYSKNPALFKRNSSRQRLSSILWLVNSREFNGHMMRKSSENKEGIT